MSNIHEMFPFRFSFSFSAFGINNSNKVLAVQLDHSFWVDISEIN